MVVLGLGLAMQEHARLGEVVEKGLAMCTVAVAAMTFGRRVLVAIDRQAMSIVPAQAQRLRPCIRFDATLQEGVIGQVDARHDASRVEGHLFGLREVVLRVPVQHQFADTANGHHFLGNQLGRVEQVEVERMPILLIHHLHAELPFGEVPRFDRIEKIAAMKIRVIA